MDNRENAAAAAAAAENWIARYVRAWSTNDPDEIRSLFTEQAEYRDGPSTPPWVGRDAIVDAWLAQKDERERGRSRTSSSRSTAMSP